MILLDAFADELVKVGAPQITQRKVSPELIAKIKRGTGRFAGGTALAALFQGLINPDVSSGRALARGASITGGMMAGGALAKKIGLGRRGQNLLSLLGSVAALRTLLKYEKAKGA